MSAVCDSTYFESVLNIKVPTMYSNTEPSGECIASSCYVHPTYPSYPYYAFDGGDDTWCSAQGDAWIQYRFSKSVKVNKIMVSPWGNNPDGNFYNKSYKLQASNDGVNFVDLTSEIVQQGTNANPVYNKITNNNYYIYYRLQCYANTSKWCGANLQLYGRSQN